MDYDSQNVQCEDKENHKKRKKTKKTQETDMNNINGTTEISEGCDDIIPVKRKICHDAEGIRKKKRKKTKDTESFEDVSASNKTEHSNSEPPEASHIDRTLDLHTDDNTENIDKNSEEAKDISKPSENIDAKYLRKMLNSPNGIDILKKFVRICNEHKERDLASEYLDAGGNIVEVLRLLNDTDKKGVSTTTIVFSAVRILLMKILADYPQHQSSAEQACRHLINSHLQQLHSMFSGQSNTKQRKIVLQLLTAMVSLGGNLPRDLLAHLSLQPSVIESLARNTHPTDSESIRICFIYFILAFLIQGNVLTIRAVLEKYGLVSSIFPELIYDSKDIVNLVLTTVKTYILNNVGISKTMKLHLFTTSITQSLVCLYNWKGPSNWPKSKVVSTHSPAYLEDKEVVTDVVHDFLTTLLTSHRHGIVFHDRTLGTSHSKHNQLVNTVLQSLDRPWEHQKPSDLVIKIIAACPDLIKSQLILLEPYVEPRVSTKWLTLMKFVQKMISSIEAESCLKKTLLELNASQLSDAVTCLTVPEMLLKNVIIPSLNHDSVIIRHEAISLLTVMFDQIKKFLLAVDIIYGDNIDQHKFKNYMVEYIVKNVPNLDIILNVWSKVFVLSENVGNTTEKEDILEPKKDEHLNAILNLLCIYNEVCPELLHVSVDLQPCTLLTTLDELTDIDINELNCIKVKTIQFLLILDPAEFAPHQKIFSNTLSFLVSLLNKDMTNSSDVVIVTKTLLNVTGIFEGCNNQLDIWVNGFINCVDLSEKQNLINWFIVIIQKAVQNVEEYVNNIIKIEEIVSEQVKYTGKIEDIFDDLLDEDKSENILRNNILHMQRLSAISPLLSCILCELKENSFPVAVPYVSYVLLHTLHYQVTPECLIHLSKDIDELPIQKYFLSWMKNNRYVRIKKIFPSMSLMSKLGTVLVSDTKLQINEILTNDNVFSFKCGTEDVTIDHSLSSYDVTSLFKMIIFYLSQFIQRSVFTEIQRDNYTILLIALLRIAKQKADEDSTLLDECTKSIFTHPIILQYFSPFGQKRKNTSKIMITHMIYDISTVITDLGTNCNITNIFTYFKDKLFAQLCKMIDKNRRGDTPINREVITALVELLRLTSENIVQLLNKLMKLDSNMFVLKKELEFSIYADIVTQILETICSEKMKAERATFFKLDAEFVTCFCSHLISLKSNYPLNFDKWEAALLKYLTNFPFNIAGINTNTFSRLLTTKITDTTVKLISYLTSTNKEFIPILTKYIINSESIKDSNIVFPIIASNLKYQWRQDFMEKLRLQYQSEIVSYFADPKDVLFAENVEAVSYLIERTFDLATCGEICNTILQIGDKLEMVPIHYVQLIQTLYSKYRTLKTDSDEPIMNFIQVLLHIITLTLKKEAKNLAKLNVICQALNTAVKHMRQKGNDFVFESLSKSHYWPQFTRFSLKLGLKESKGDNQLLILKSLNSVCDISYKNDSDNEYVQTLFEMTTSHSEFVNIMLGSSHTKRDLIELLWILVQKNKGVMKSAHIPLYLAAYNGTLSETDQLILLILQYYESNNINIHEYRPYLWGNAAAIHYSVKGETDMALWRQPTASQVLNLFEKEIINNTIKSFPIDRALKSNDLNSPIDTYDPAFYLPLLCFLLSENNVVSCHKFTQSGALALVFAACGSKHSDTRMVAYTIISRYYSHLESSSSKSKLLWMRLVDALRYGIVSLNSELTNVRLNCLVTTFLAQTSMVFLQPLNPLYSPLQKFLMAKPALDLNTIPELLQLLHSSDVDHKAHRKWILENIRDGMRTKTEMDIAFKCVLFKMLLDFYTCTLSDDNAKKAILEVIYMTTKITEAPFILMRGHGLLPWLLEITTTLHMHEARTQCIELVIKITENLLNSRVCKKGDYLHYNILLLKVLLNLKLHLLKDIDIPCFILYVNTLCKLLSFKGLKAFALKEDITKIVEFSKRILGNVDVCEDMLLHGCKYVTIETLSNDQNDIHVAKESLKAMVWNWCSQ